MRFVGIRGYYYLFMKQNIQFSLYSHNYAINNFALDYKILLRTFMLSHSPSVNHKTEMNTYYHKVNTRKVRASLKALVIYSWIYLGLAVRRRNFFSQFSSDCSLDKHFLFEQYIHTQRTYGNTKRYFSISFGSSSAPIRYGRCRNNYIMLIIFHTTFTIASTLIKLNRTFDLTHTQYSRASR